MNGTDSSEDLKIYVGPWDHQATVDWLATQPGMLGDYRGEWVAFAGRRIIAHAPDLDEVIRCAEEARVNDPLLVPVPPTAYLVG
jgi:hypothetical protein